MNFHLSGPLSPRLRACTLHTCPSDWNGVNIWGLNGPDSHQPAGGHFWWATMSISPVVISQHVPLLVSRIQGRLMEGVESVLTATVNHRSRKIWIFIVENRKRAICMKSIDYFSFIFSKIQDWNQKALNSCLFGTFLNEYWTISSIITREQYIPCVCRVLEFCTQLICQSLQPALLWLQHFWVN